VVLCAPGTFPKVYTLRELARRGAAVGSRSDDQTVADWLTQVHAGRRPTDLLGMSADDDIADPTGSNAVDHRTTAEEIDALTGVVLDLLF
jgi:hypothetical protein